MTHEQAFLQAIKNAPNDNDLRLIFADWLEEHGQPERAELIRLQIDRARLPAHHRRQASLKQREEQLLAQHGKSWLGRWAGCGFIRRGLVHIQGQVVHLQRLLEEGGAEADLLWVEGLRLRGRWEEIQPVLSRSWIRHFTALDLWGNRIGNAGARALAASVHLDQLASLDLGYNCIGSVGVQALGSSAHLGNLAFFNLWGNDIGEGDRAMLRQRYGDVIHC